MPIIYSPAVKLARLQAVAAAMGPTAVLEIGTAGMADVLLRFTLDTPAGVATGSALTLSGFPKQATALLTGVAASARIRTAAAASGETIISGLTIGTSSAFDIAIGSLAIQAGDTVAINSFSISHG